MDKPFIHYYEENQKGRDFWVSDLHGHFDLLHEALRDVAFDSNVDRLFVGGDNCDRGPDSKHILDYLNEPWYISIRGNHEEMVISYIEALAEAGGDAYSVRQPFEMLFCNGGQWFFDITDSHQMRIYESFKSLPLAIEYKTKDGKKVGMIHAECPYNNWDEFKKITQAELTWNGEAIAQWARTKYDRQNEDVVKGLDILLTGHTPTKTGNIEKLGNVYYTDAGSFFRNKINLVEIKELLK
jgi:serine/threonine protein phosphatase 1